MKEKTEMTGDLTFCAVKQILRCSIEKLVLLAAVCLLLGCAVMAAPADWPQFQYDVQHTGFNPHANVQLPLELKFEKRIGATQLMPVSVYDGLAMSIVYVLPREGGDTVFCYDATTGEDVWTDMILPYCSGTTQAVAGYGMWFIQANRETDGWVSAHDLHTGELKWVNTYPTQADQCLAPVLYDSVLMHESGTYGGIEAINAITGETQWWQKWFQIEAWSPSVFRDSVYCYLNYHLACTAVHEPDSGVLVAYTLLDDPCLPEDYPPVDKRGSHEALTAVVFDTTRAIALLFEQEGLWAYDMNTREYLWKVCAYFAQDYHWRHFPNPAIKDGRVYVPESGRLAVYGIMTGDELWSFDAEGEFAYPPVLTNDYVFVSAQFHTYMVDLETHEQVWSYPAGGYLSVANDMLYIAGYLGTVYAFGPAPTDIADQPADDLPTDYSLSQNYPNPFNPSTTIEFSLPEQTYIRLTVFNIQGQEVTTLINGVLSAGTHKRVWDGTTTAGGRVSSGVYFYRLTTATEELSNKMLLLK